MAINWNTVEKGAVAAAKASLVAVWNNANIASAAQHSIQLLVQTGQYIETNAKGLTPSDYQLVVNTQKLAMQNVLLGYEDIGIAAAEQAVAAAWGVIATALQNALGLKV